MTPPGQELKDDITRFCRERGADLVGFAPAERWDEGGAVPPAFRPTALFPPTRTVIVIGMSMPLPVVETTPSALHKELYDTTNRQLDDLAVELTRHLNRMGHASMPFTRDTYTSMRALRENNLAAFGHVPAATYAGLGTIGVNRCVLTPEFGPRVRFVSVFTEAALPPDPLQPKELCICADSARHAVPRTPSRSGKTGSSGISTRRPVSRCTRSSSESAVTPAASARRSARSGRTACCTKARASGKST